jgi:hypothetical protein
VLGPLLPAEARKTGELIDSTLDARSTIDEPVASGGDPSLWSDDDDKEGEPK